MTAQEIEDVRMRVESPVLELRLGHPTPDASDNQRSFVFRAGREILNTSPATATFAVITLAMLLPNSAYSRVENAWTYIGTDQSWSSLRNVFASGSFPRCSPITPGFTATPEYAIVDVPRIETEGSWRVVGIARLDHDGGTRLYWLEFGPHAGLVLRLRPYPGNLDWRAFNVPAMFEPGE